MPTKDILNRGRVLLHGLVYSDTGNVVPPLRWTRQALRFANDLSGQPLISADELARREAELRSLEEAVQTQRSDAAAAKPAKREAAPVVLYITDQDQRTRKKIEEILKGRDIPYTINDVTDDESSRSWALTQSHKPEFPLLFVAGEPLGNVDDVMQLDVRGELVKKVFG